MSKFRDEADDYDLTYCGQSDAAWCFRTGEVTDEERVWLPKSQVDLGGPPVVGKVISVTIPNWLAEDKGLV